MRNVYHTIWNPLEISPIQILKAYPLAFMFVQKPWFLGLPNLLQFVRPHDDEEIDVPLFTYKRDRHAVWPAIPTGNTLMLLAGDSFGFVGNKN